MEGITMECIRICERDVFGEDDSGEFCRDKKSFVDEIKN